jgi:hypothetical protein
MSLYEREATLPEMLFDCRLLTVTATLTMTAMAKLFCQDG